MTTEKHPKNRLCHFCHFPCVTDCQLPDGREIEYCGQCGKILDGFSFQDLLEMVAEIERLKGGVERNRFHYDPQH